MVVAVAVSSLKNSVSEPLVNLKASKVVAASLAAFSGYLFLPLSAVQATSLGFGVTALYVAAREYQFINQLEKAPLKLPEGKFDVSAFQRPELEEPWLDTLKFCALSINACGGVFLVSQLATVPPLFLGYMALGGATRFLSEALERFSDCKLDQLLAGKLYKQQWIGLGVALLAIRLFQSIQPAIPILNQTLMVTSGFFAAGLLVQSIALATQKPRFEA